MLRLGVCVCVRVDHEEASIAGRTVKRVFFVGGGFGTFSGS